MITHVRQALNIVLGVALVATAARDAAAQAGLGVYFGLIYEASRFDGQSARVLEGESGRIGIMIGRWSDVGYLVTNRWWVQPQLFLIVGRGEVTAYQPGAQPPATPPEQGTGTVIEPSAGVGASLGPIFRLDGRAGMRFGGDVTVGTRTYSVTGAVASATVRVRSKLRSLCRRVSFSVCSELGMLKRLQGLDHE